MILIKGKISIHGGRITMVILALIFYGCVEPFEPKTIDFESALVIEATITNEIGVQQVNLSRSFSLNSEGLESESDATVRVIDELGNEQVFQESEPGVYLSVNNFGAMPNMNYTLLVNTSEGGSYASDSVRLTAVTQLDDLYAERIITDRGEDGIGIFIDSFDPTGSSQNYRYEYEETYKIIAPNWKPLDLVPSSEPGCNVITVPRSFDEQICFATDFSNTNILTNTNNLTEDRVDRFLVRFVNRNNYILSHRYSILVRQFVQSNETYTFFETLNGFSGSESLLSETQPGFLIGNVSSTENAEEKVLGYFDVASVNEKRIFFDYQDFFSGEELPPYAVDCTVNSPPISRGAPPVCVLRPQVEAKIVKYFGENGTPGPGEGPFFVVARACGDCTALGGTKVPDFWIE